MKGRKVKSLEYECYKSMAVKEFEKIYRDIKLKWMDVRRVAVAHRLGLV